MSQSESTFRVIDPRPAADDLGLATMNALARPVGAALAPRLPRGFFAALFTFGLLPILSWSTFFDRFAIAERQQLWHFCQWLRLRTGNPDLDPLIKRANVLGRRPVLRVLTNLLAIGTIVITTLRLHAFIDDPARSAAAPLNHSWLRMLIVATWQHGQMAIYPIHWLSRIRYAPFVSLPVINELASIALLWNIGLSLAYISHWLRVQLHGNDVRRLIDQLNIAAPNEALLISPIRPAGVGFGWGLPWLIAAGGLMAAGGIWGLPMAIAGCVHRRYIRRISVGNRLALAGWMRQLLLQQRPVVDVPVPYYLRRLCQRAGCRAAASPTARFCRRCGEALQPVLDRVA